MREAIPEWFSPRPSSRCSPRPPSTSPAPASWRAASRRSKVRRPPRDPLHHRQPGRPAAPADPARVPGPRPIPRSGRGRRSTARGLVVDGELVVWDTAAGRLSFEALQRRAAARSRTASALAAKSPAFFIAFDALQIDGIELLTLPYTERRRRLEVLFAARALTAPWTLCPMTTDPAKAREWLEGWTDVTGVEGLVVKALNQRYRPGARDRAWTKIRRRNTTEAITGAITGTLTRPQLLILGRHDPTGRLRPIGRTVPLRPDAARQLAEHLTPAGSGHPWTGAKFSSAWGTRGVLDTTLVQPGLVAEIMWDIPWVPPPLSLPTGPLNRWFVVLVGTPEHGS
ncbi:ATP-dependent DNA ligase [Streptomyces sp. NBC_01443]|uniref:ATP-dependent DNA ligase n=1 Tax=Streptomyces sp. NBC_01443 TaxID=2903868 RepID=UPI00225B53AA|nr:ATP-dependent DNA ligase [Streptomyces sp. NBC_01443]MCX4625177.1 ATP-dependent DNA ligase [Streptomyces sp. NBC_01443]MCX4633542.1 ATP-dependent DNA ligase [Streptomyces sp. NBC_01443]